LVDKKEGGSQFRVAVTTTLMTLVTVMVVVLRRGGKRGGKERRRLEVQIYKCVIDKLSHAQSARWPYNTSDQTRSCRATENVWTYYAPETGSDFINKAGIRCASISFRNGQIRSINWENV